VVAHTFRQQYIFVIARLATGRKSYVIQQEETKEQTETKGQTSQETKA
jgi:hypothetical protein